MVSITSILTMPVITHLAVLEHLRVSRDVVLHCWPVVCGRRMPVVIWRGEPGPCILSWSLSAVSVAAVILFSEALDKLVCLDPVADTTLAVLLLAR